MESPSSNLIVDPTLPANTTHSICAKTTKRENTMEETPFTDDPQRSKIQTKTMCDFVVVFQLLPQQQLPVLCKAERGTRFLLLIPFRNENCLITFVRERNKSVFFFRNLILHLIPIEITLPVLYHNENLSLSQVG